MYRSCMFCRKPLGTNEVIESFPVGRRLAFDAARGRLWVVCRKCERWNLTPLEERWEAVEDCERIFRDTRVRVSTDNIGLARHPEGLTLVRIGEPMRPEFAAWRYGDQFGRRRRKTILYGAAGVAVFGGIMIGGAAAGIFSGFMLSQSGNFVNMWMNSRTLVKLHPEEGGTIKLKRQDLLGTRVRPAADDLGFKLQVRKGKKKTWHEGPEARRFAGAILPRMNSMGGTKETVQHAVGEIESLGHPERFLLDVAAGDRFQDKKGVPGYINKMPKPTKLALEMALHEEQERRALEGELWLLEQAWREAEEIAEISDNLFLPEGTGDFIREHRGDRAEREGHLGGPARVDSGRTDAGRADRSGPPDADRA
ncbi:MAG: hypothetical protein OXH51_04515 [Gemmatimonadetes bacterium]|nr:hypothetical protein [Gemmatimonadota bacterium]MCY3679555.1 hypothetical protein [Gemmatimonadota bacterium]MYA42127.1 hypothetical protein [Gemmatimonadota bacterium]MYE92052.1 hypothetical protein [Gemmatimonadota bacterium]MYJ12076.1 hypothetical protein [Gemmatimonadota bacterium]